MGVRNAAAEMAIEAKHKTRQYYKDPCTMMNSSPHARLAAEVLIRAVEDWREQVRRNPRGLSSEELERQLRRRSSCGQQYLLSVNSFEALTAFFKSDWCDTLLTLTGAAVTKEAILDQLEHERWAAIEKLRKAGK